MNSKKTPFWVLFGNFKGEQELFWKTRLYHFFCFLFLDLYFCTVSQKKTNEQIPRKVSYRRTHEHTHVWTDKHEFIGPFLLEVYKKQPVIVGLISSQCPTLFQSFLVYLVACFAVYLAACWVNFSKNVRELTSLAFLILGCCYPLKFANSCRRGHGCLWITNLYIA